MPWNPTPVLPPVGQVGWRAPVHSTLVAPAMQASAQMRVPTILVGLYLPIPPMVATAQMRTPSVGVTPAPLVAPKMIASAMMRTPTVGVGYTLVAPKMIATSTMRTPTLSVGQALVAPKMLASATMKTPVVDIGTFISAPRMQATATMPVPSLSAGESLTAPLMAATAQMRTPGLSVGEALVSPLMAATATMRTPVLSVAEALAAPLMSASAQMLAPTLSVGEGMVAPVMAATAAMLVPTVAVQASGPAFDAQSATQKFNSSTSGYTFSHTATAGAAVVVAVVNQSGYEPTGVTYGGAAMTLKGEVTVGTYTRVELYTAIGVSGGSQNVVVTHNLGFQNTIAVAISYLNVASISAGTVTASSFGTFSRAVTVTSGQMAFQVIGTVLGVFTTSSGGTQRVMDTANSTTQMIVRDSLVSTTFTAGGSNQYNAGVGVILNS